jgi:hypothetical protein
MQKTIKSLMKSWNTLKEEVSDYVQEKNIKIIQKTIEALIKEAANNVADMAQKDFSDLKKRIMVEKKRLEATINDVKDYEVNQVASFMKSHKSEIHSLRNKLDKLIETLEKGTKKSPKKAHAKKTAPKRKVAKK